MSGLDFSRTIAGLIQHRANLCPSAIAIRHGKSYLTYEELERRSSAVAASLTKGGIVAGDCVGLYSDRSPELVIGMLGILKAGSTYLPLDPHYPMHRRSFSIAESKCKLALTSLQHNKLPALDVRSISILDAERESVVRGARTDRAIGPDEAAYLIYTSGSTGRPNGVIGLHGPLMHYIQWLIEYFVIAPEDKILNVSSISFDPSLRDILVPLSAGATLVLLSQKESKDPLAYIRCIREQQITRLLSITPTLLRRVCESDELPGDSLTSILTCGETLTYTLASLVREKFGPSTRMFNMYGPTECTMTTTVFDVEPDILGREGAVPIGFERRGAKIYLLSENCIEVPDGTVGEMYIGGSGLSGGYLDRQDLMRQRFILWPETSVAPELLFKTGDFGRRLSNGALVFEGRVDNQMKIRGERIEVGEIEAAFMSSDLIKEAAAVVLPEGVYAVIVSHSKLVDIREQVLACCRSRLSAVALPREVFVVESLPCTPSGKLDRRALREYVILQRGRRAYSPPETALERSIATIWQRVLGCEQVSVEADFLAVGGDSIQAANIASRLSQALSLDIPSYFIIESMTIRNLALIIEESGKYELMMG